MRQIFNFFGIMLHSIHGDDYLSKKKFFVLVKNLIHLSGKFDHILFLIVDNLNFDTSSGLCFLNNLLELGSQRIKHYALIHLKCLIFSGKEINWSYLTFLFNSVNDPLISKIISEIVGIIFEKSSNISSNENLNFLFPIIEKISKEDITILYHLMKNEKLVNDLKSYIKKECEKINVKDVLNSYSFNMEHDINKIFPLEEGQGDYTYLNINLPHTVNQYNHMAEFFWIKQLPFNFNIIVMENFGQNNYESLLCDCYLEYDEIEDKLMLISHIKDNISFNIEKDSLKFICNLGEKIIDSNAKINLQGSMLTFDIKDFKNLKKVSLDNLL